MFLSVFLVYRKSTVDMIYRLHLNWLLWLLDSPSPVENLSHHQQAVWYSCGWGRDEKSLMKYCHLSRKSRRCNCSIWTLCCGVGAGNGINTLTLCSWHAQIPSKQERACQPTGIYRLLVCYPKNITARLKEKMTAWTTCWFQNPCHTFSSSASSLF